ncbi:MAG: DUF1566 domain-containing protein [Leptospira sp.]|nr:DUF1566 domain-containing protein [Leptospira sp.]
MRLLSRHIKLILTILVSLIFHNCLTGYYLSQEVFGTKKSNYDEFVLLGFISNSNLSVGGSRLGEVDLESLRIVATPSFSPIAGPRTTNSLITLTTTTADATIYYTTDGTTPNTSSTQYSAPIANVWSLAGKNIRAIAFREGYENSEVVSGVYSLPPIKTGQSACWNAVGTPIDCTGSGQDGDLQPGIARGYTDNGNGTVTDNATGLIWQKCSRGQSGDFCSGSLGGSNWATAVNYCTSLDLAGETWRLPSRQELETLPDNSFADPAIDSNFFPNSQSFDGFWTSTTNAQNTTRAWHVNFVYGVVNHLLKTTGDPFNARCVTGATKGYSNHFTDNEDGTIRDNTTSLVWQKCTRGQINDTICSGTATQTDWQASITYCNELNFAGRTTWRLPSINELKSIVDTNQSTLPAIDSTVFPSTDSNLTSAYWSSTTSSSLPRAINVNFGTGTVGDAVKNIEINRYVRCVSSD